MVVGLGARPTTLDPRFATDANSTRVTDLLYTSLTRWSDELQPMPWGAESWDISKNKITLHIRKNLEFQNGAPVTVDDVFYTLEQYRKPSCPFSNLFSYVGEMTKGPNNTIIFEMKEPDASFLGNLADVKIIPKGSVEKFGNKLAQNPMGSGPYNFKSQDTGELILTKKPHALYGHAQKIIFKYIRDDNTRFLKLLKGDVDVVLNDLLEDKVADLLHSGRLNVVITPGLNFNYLLINFKNKYLARKEFRTAMSSAINREDIVNYKLESFGLPAISILSPVNPFSSPDLKLPSLSEEAAKKVMSYFKGEISFKTAEQAAPNGKVLANEFEQIGLPIKLQSFEWGTYYNDVKSGNFDLALMRWVGVSDPDIYRQSLGSAEFPPGKNRGRYSNKAFDQLVVQAHHELNFEKRFELYKKAQAWVAEDLPIIPLWYNSNISILNKRVKDFKPSPTGNFYPLLNVQLGPIKD